MEILERFGINSEVICMFFGLVLGWLIGITPTLLRRVKRNKYKAVVKHTGAVIGAIILGIVGGHSSSSLA